MTWPIEPRVVERTRYAVPITVEHYLAIEKAEKYAEWKDCLGGRLEALGAFDIEYNGHFGAYIFYTLGADDDTPEKHEAIAQLIRTTPRR